MRTSTICPVHSVSSTSGAPYNWLRVILLMRNSLKQLSLNFPASLSEQSRPPQSISFIISYISKNNIKMQGFLRITGAFTT